MLYKMKRKRKTYFDYFGLLRIFLKLYAPILKKLRHCESFEARRDFGRLKCASNGYDDPAFGHVQLYISAMEASFYRKGLSTNLFFRPSCETIRWDY